jgi:hypothetical protein
MTTEISDGCRSLLSLDRFSFQEFGANLFQATQSPVVLRSLFGSGRLFSNTGR